MHAPTWTIFCARASTASSPTIRRWGARPSMTCSNRSLETARRRAPACCLRLLQPLLHTGGLGAEHGAEAMYAHGPDAAEFQDGAAHLDRKSTRLNSSHSQISYAVFCLKK